MTPPNVQVLGYDGIFVLESHDEGGVFEFRLGIQPNQVARVKLPGLGPLQVEMVAKEVAAAIKRLSGSDL